MLTRMLLKDAADGDMSTYVYKGKQSENVTFTFHSYDKSLPSVLLVDGRGYVRWHAVGLPSEEAADLARAALKRLAKESQSTCSF